MYSKMPVFAFLYEKHHAAVDVFEKLEPCLPESSELDYLK